MWCFWSVKGSAGCSVTATSVALRLAKRFPVLLVDLAGDLPAVLGLDEPRQNLVDWLDAESLPPDALARLEVGVAERLSLLAWHDRAVGAAWSTPSRFGRSRVGLLAQMLAREQRRVVVDLGRWSRRPDPDRANPESSSLAESVLSLADHSTLVTRPDSVALLAEPGRSLRSLDIERAVQAPVFELKWDPAVARSADVGMTRVRMPRSSGAFADRLESARQQQ